jgi:hypothetical protein
MYGLETIEEDEEYCVHLADGATLKVTVNQKGNLEETVERFDRNSSRTMPYKSLSTDLKSFIRARTGREFEPAVDD